MRFSRSPLVSCAAICATAFATSALSLEYPLGSPQNLAGMEVVAVYLQAIAMEPEGHMKKATESDIHALANNPNGSSG
jgi:uncharacterized protein involved in high-affinity Fe2+ transport